MSEPEAIEEVFRSESTSPSRGLSEDNIAWIFSEKMKIPVTMGLA